jgi:dienelactone hydrolase
MPEHPPPVKRHLDRLYAESERRYACRADSPEAFRQLLSPARGKFRQLLGLPRIAELAADHSPSVTMAGETENLDGYSRRRGWIETEPNVRIPFWHLTPAGKGPFPLALTPHGHGNGDTYVGLPADAITKKRIEEEDRDVAVQAVRRGFLTIAPYTRGLGPNPQNFRIADIANRHDSDCRGHNWHVITAGRTALGERVWDLLRLLDWALERDEVDSSPVLVLGSSGGGMVTLHAAACDERIGIAVPCCAYNNYVSFAGTLRHCPCNAVPGLLQFGEMWDVAGLIAPRPLLTVNGREDSLHPVEEVDQAVERLRAIYSAAGVPANYEHRYGEGGHRIYSDLMWPWIEQHAAGT